jgi:hypothetical protein
MAIQVALPHSDLYGLATRLGLNSIDVKCRYSFSDGDIVDTMGSVVDF